MATPTNDTYTRATSGPVSGGRYPESGAASANASAAAALAVGKLVAGAAAAAALAAGTLGQGHALAGAAAGVATASGNLSAGAPGAALTSFSLTSSDTTGTKPFTIGLGFKKGDANSITTDLAQCQVVVMRRWSDNSIKHAIVSGRAALTQNVARQVQVQIGTPPGGGALTSSSIQAAAPTASVQCGGLGTVSLAGLLASPVRTWVSGPEMVECHYRADVGSTLLSVWFHVRLFADNRVWVRAIVENGYLDNGSGAVAGNADRSYVPTVSIGGSNVYTNGGASLAHYKNTRWSVEGWIGGDPQVTFSHDVSYLDASKLVPHYGWREPTAGVFSTFLGNGGVTPQSWAANYTPMAQGDWDADMGAFGYQPFIGLLPLPNALYLTTGDSRMLGHSLKNSSAMNSRPIVWRDKTTNLIPKPSDFPNWSILGNGGAGEDEIATGAGLYWEQPHHPLEGYFAYLLTGDYWHYETLAMEACCNYVYRSSTPSGSGTGRQMLPTQIRGIAWMMRTVGAYAAIAPTGDTVAADYRAWLEQGGFDFWATKIPSGGNGLGYLVIGLATDPGNPLRTNPWQHHFWIAVNGFLWDIEPGVSSTTSQLAIRDFMYKAIVGIMGPKSTDGSTYSHVNASLYDGLIVSDGLFQAGVTEYFATTPVPLHTSWGAVWEDTFPGTNTHAAGELLLGSGSGIPSNAAFGYWGNLIPALAYAVDHDAPGAESCWGRLVGTYNWDKIDYAGFDNTPVWGIKPRWTPSYTVPTALYTSVALTGGNSLYSVKPASHTNAQAHMCMQNYGGPTENPAWNIAGFSGYDLSGGHADVAMLGRMGVDWKTGQWVYTAPANGIAENPNPYVFPGDLDNLTYGEITASGPTNKMPAPPHVYNNRVYLNEGPRGSYLFCGRASLATGGGETTGAIHKKRQEATPTDWLRATNDTLAYSTLESGAFIDPKNGRIYLISQQNHTRRHLAYFDPATGTCGRTDAPPDNQTITNDTGVGASSYQRGFVDHDTRTLWFHYGPKMFVRPMDGTPRAWTELTAITWPASGQRWFRADGAWWLKDNDNSNTFWKLKPGANPVGGTAVLTQQTVGGAGLPNFFPQGPGVQGGHKSALQHLPGLGRGVMAWIYGAEANQSVIFRASGA